MTCINREVKYKMAHMTGVQEIRATFVLVMYEGGIGHKVRQISLWEMVKKKSGNYSGIFFRKLTLLLKFKVQQEATRKQS